MGSIAGSRDLAVEELVASRAMDLDALLLSFLQQWVDLFASEAFDCLFHREGGRGYRIRDKWFHFVLLLSFDLSGEAHLVLLWLLLLFEGFTIVLSNFTSLYDFLFIYDQSYSCASSNVSCAAGNTLSIIVVRA